MAEERSGFLGRWARRKTDALQGRPLEEPVVAAKPAPAPVAGAASSPGAATNSGLDSEPASAPEPLADAPAPPEKVLSLDDVKALTQSSDFKPFMAQGVGPQVRNAAMKKLFADPHYNVMDGLDIYIDDYSIADPLPLAMLRQMAGAKFLNLFEDDEKDEKDEKDPQNRQSAKELGRAAAQDNAAPADAAPADSAQADAAQTDAEQADEVPAPADSPTHPHTETVAKSGEPSGLAPPSSQLVPLPSDPSPKPT